VLFERALGVEGFAQWAFLNAALTIAVPVACMGSNHLVLSEFYEGRLNDRESVAAMLRYFGAWAAVTLVVLLPSYAAAAPAGQRASVLVLSALFIAQLPIILVFPVFQARSQAGWVAAWPLAQVMTRLLVAFSAWLAAWRFGHAVLAWTLASVVLAAIALRQMLPALRARMSRAEPAAGLDRPGLGRPGLAFGMSDLLDSLDLKLLVPLAAVLFDPVATAAAGVAVVLLSALYFLPHVLISRVLLPAVHRHDGAGAAPVRRFVLRLAGLCALALTPLAIAWYWLGVPFVSALVRGDYASQAAAIALLGLAAVPMCLSQMAAAPYMGRRRAGRLLRWRLEALVLFLLLAAALRSLGLQGLVVAFAAARLFLCARLLVRLGREGESS
jgi:O-antigen/teichoic acid export membrane protein